MKIKSGNFQVIGKYQMLYPVTRRVFRWSTPDPEWYWNMVGHLIFSNEGIIMIDPPNVPGLIDALKRLGNIEAVILTTADHLRAAPYFSWAYGVDIYLPRQVGNHLGDDVKYRVGRLKNPILFNTFKTNLIQIIK